MEIAALSGHSVGRESYAVPVANEQPRLERGLVINLVEASGEEALPLSFRGRGAGDDQRAVNQKKYGQNPVLHASKPWRPLTVEVWLIRFRCERMADPTGK